MSAHFTYRDKPIVVIDPADHEAVRRLADAFCTARWSHIEGSNECDPLTFTSMQTALREFASPTPPRPDEPTGLGAVVEDTDGKRWVKVDTSMDCDAWTEADAGWSGNDTWRKYEDLAVVRVLSPGVES